MYTSIHDLPFVCQLNLPEAALHVYREAFNEAWHDAGERPERFAISQNHAWDVVRQQFARDVMTGRWIAKAAPAPRRRIYGRSAVAAVSSASALD